jgi:hypothetical protein
MKIPMITFIGLSCLLSVPTIGQEITVPIDREHWAINDWKRWPANAALSTFGEQNGRPSLHVASGLAYVPELNMQDGVIEAEVLPDPRGAFFGIAFRVQSTKNFELIYFRPGSSGTTEAVQYTPTLNGAIAWQLYHGEGAQAAADFSLEKWMHVRIEISGSVARLYLNGQSQPTLVVPHLAQGDSSGSVGFWGLFGGGYISQLRYEVHPGRASASIAKSEDEPGVIRNWELSDAFDSGVTSPLNYPNPSSLKWEAVSVEPNGLLVINRYRESPEIMPTPPREQMKGVVPGAKVVFARSVVQSDSVKVVPMWIGYSDEAVVYLNGTPIFNGKNAWRFRDEGSGAGLLDYNDRVFLPLHKGANELIVAVTEYMGGWGLQCKLEK